MRRLIMIGLGVIAVGGIAACADTQSPGPASTPTSAAATTTTTTGATATTTAGPIGQADAERIAVDAVPGSRVTETRLDTERGRAVWNVHLSTPNGNVEIKVDVRTGAIVADDQPNPTASSPGHS